MNTEPHVDSGPPADHANNRHSLRTRRWMLLALVAIVAWGAVYLFRWATAPQPPAVPLDGLDPAIVSVLEQCYDAVRRNPRSGQAWGKLGTGLLEYEFQREARDCFRRAQRYDPANPRWPYFFGLSMFPDSPDEGLAKLRKAVDLYGDASSAPRNRLATILTDQGQFDEAEKHFRIVLQRWPDDPLALLGLGKVALARGKLEESSTYLRRSARDRHTAKTSRQLLAMVYQRLGNTDAATQMTREMKAMPQDLSISDPFFDEASELRTGRTAWLDDATQLYRQGRFAEAKRLVRRTVRMYPDSADAWSLLGQIQMRQRDFVAAQSSWDKALERAPESVEAHVQLGVVQLQLGKADAAVKCFLRAIELKPNLSEAHYNLGLAYTTTGQTDKAIEAFREAIRLRPGLVDSYLGLANSLAASGDLGGAQKALEQAQEISPNDERVGRFRKRYGMGSNP